MRRQLLEHEQRGDDAGVGAEVVAEVVVRGVLAAEDRAGLGHHLLDERVPDARADRDAAELAHDLGDGLRADQVVHDLLAGVTTQDRRRQHRGGGGPGHRLRLVVDQHDAVGVAVEREAHRGVGVEHRALEVLEVVGVGGVGRVVGERAVELAEEQREVEREPGEHRRRDQAADAVGGVGDDAQRRERVEVDERVHVGDERRQQVARLGAARVFGALEQPTGDHGLDLGQPGVLPDGQGAGPAQLHAVVLGRVVAGGEHRGRGVEAAGGEVAEVGGGLAEVDDVGAGHDRALGERRDQGRRRRPGVAADEHAGRAGERHEGVADAAGDRLVELVGIDPANVIGLEDGVERRVGHWSLGSSPRRAGRESYPPTP